jgi:hypothetical protein
MIELLKKKMRERKLKEDWGLDLALFSQKKKVELKDEEEKEEKLLE